MKKNAMLKIAAILMVAVLLTTCAISSTFAKYTTSDSDTATARVAKWGVTVDVDADDAFLSTYSKGNEELVVAGAPVIAPGTSVDEAITITVSGDPEVKTEVVFNDGTNASQNFITFTGWEIDNVKSADEDDTIEYCPVVFVIDGVKYCTDDAGLTAVDGQVVVCSDLYTNTDEQKGLQATINAAIAGLLGTEYSAGELAQVDVTIGWYWNFEVDNIYDTELGNAIDEDEDAAKVDFNMNISIAQKGPASVDK